MLRGFVLILVAALTWPAPCLALTFPPAMTQDELWLKSDLVALVRVLSVTCTAVIQDPDTKQSLPTSHPNLKFAA